MENFDKNIELFLDSFNNEVQTITQELREIIKNNLNDIQEQFDLSAKMIAYSYGNKYSQMICTIIPSKKGVKLGFSRGVDLPDPNNILQGSGKISRFIQLIKIEDINIELLNKYLTFAYYRYLELNKLNKI